MCLCVCVCARACVCMFACLSTRPQPTNRNPRYTPDLPTNRHPGTHQSNMDTAPSTPDPPEGRRLSDHELPRRPPPSRLHPQNPRHRRRHQSCLLPRLFHQPCLLQLPLLLQPQQLLVEVRGQRRLQPWRGRGRGRRGIRGGRRCSSRRRVCQSPVQGLGFRV